MNLQYLLYIEKNLDNNNIDDKPFLTVYKNRSAFNRSIGIDSISLFANETKGLKDFYPFVMVGDGKSNAKIFGNEEYIQAYNYLRELVARKKSYSVA